MKIVRQGVFETNSSSTHSICIAKGDNYNIPKRIHFGIGEWGWSSEELSDGDMADYLYTGLLACNRMDDIAKLKEILDKHGISYEFEKPKMDSYGNGKDKQFYLANGGIDHCGELYDFLDAVMTDEKLLFRYLFNDDSCVYTGNDNSSDYTDMCNAADEKIWDDDTRSMVPNPNHHPDRFDYFDKGN